MTVAADPMEALRGRFRGRLSEERAVLAEAAAKSDRATLRAICHRIAGAGGMFGYGDLSDLASLIEEGLDGGAPCPALRTQVSELLAAIDAATIR